VSRRSSVRKALINVYIPEIRGSVPGYGYFNLTSVPKPNQGTGARPGYEAEHVPPLGADVKNKWSHNFSLPYALIGRHFIRIIASLPGNMACRAELQCVRKVAVHLGYGTYIWLSVSKLPLQCAVF
jgi:hypothetical protein